MAVRKKTARKKKTGTGKREKKISRSRRPEEMSLESWQVALRRQFGRAQNFKLKNVGDEPFFSEFEVTNPDSERTYRVAVRGTGLGENYCSCPDFTVNTLGTCKHVEFALGKLQRKRGGKKALAAGFHPDYSEVYVRHGAQRRVMFRPGTDCPAKFHATAKRYFDTDGLLKEDAFARFHTFLKQTATAGHEVRCYDDALALVARVRDRAALVRRIDEAFPRGIAGGAFGRLLKIPLHRYQRTGALFAAKAGRCLLADDMGLGKTVQAIAAAEILARCAGLERVLIVSPTSLKHQWKDEIEKFSDRDALVVEGLLPQRSTLYAAESFYKITNYDVVHRDLELIRRWEPELIVLDEAQRIKNWKTRTAQTVKQLDSPYAMVLTGTPLENRLEELHSIVEFVDRHRLGPTFRFLDRHQHVDENGRVVGYRDLSQISKTLEPILIRRTKDEVLKELPERLEKRLFVTMTPEQVNHHEENREIVARLVAKWRRFGFLSESDQRRLMICLQNMRMSCNSTYLLDQSTDFGTKIDEAVDQLSDLLEDPGTKVVVFSQWLRTHELLVERLKKKRWGHVMFHGRIPGTKRKALIQQFKEDPDCRLFLSTDAGGVGLNLQNAAAVLNLDQPWNPAVLEQRIGRVHRMGQAQPVRVIHIIARDTIEEGMLKLLAFKSAMFSGVLDGGRDEVFLGGSRLKRFMESVETATGGDDANGMGDMTEASAETSAETPPLRSNGKPRETDAAEAPSKRAAQQSQPAPQEQALAELLKTGASLLGKLGEALAAGPDQPKEKTAGGASSPVVVDRDPKTGQTYLKLPVPEPEAVRKIVQLLGGLLKGD